MFIIAQAHTEADLAEIKALFLEYADFLGFDLCFQGFAEELATLPGEYAPPAGRLYLVCEDGRAAGCVALRPCGEGRAEMKRLYVRPEFRGRGLGRKLAETVAAEARAIGYAAVCLDTVPALREAIQLYRAVGFREIAPYRANPIPGALFLELTLPEEEGTNG